MNTFKKGDKVSWCGDTFEVKRIDGPYVYLLNLSFPVHYEKCTLISSKPKFGPGDVVTNGIGGERTIFCVRSKDANGCAYNGPTAYDYCFGGWDREINLTLVKSANDVMLDFIKAGKKIDAVKQHRLIHGTGLKEAKDAVEALERNGVHHTLGDILNAALKPKFKKGDRVKHNFGNTVYLVGEINSHGWFLCVGYEVAGYNNPDVFTLVSSPSPAIVARKYGDDYRPSTNPLLHATVDDAKKEAERLATANPGVEFGTFVLAHRSTATAPTVTTVAA